MKIFFVLILIILHFGVFAQHNSSYSQYMFNGLLLNPAYAGSNEALNLTALYRKQWLGINGSPTTMNFTAHMPLKNEKVSLGIILVGEKLGVSEHNKLNFVYAYRFKLLKGQFSLGLQAGFDAHRANWEQVRTTQLRDPSFAVNIEKRILPQAGFGIYYYNKSLFVGLSIPSIIANNFNLYKTTLFNLGCIMNLFENFNIKPALLIKYILNSPTDANLSTTFYWKDIFGLGLGCSVNRTAQAYMDLKVNNQFRFGYAYDYPFNNLQNYNSGSHEIMLRYLFQYKVKVLSTRYF